MHSLAFIQQLKQETRLSDSFTGLKAIFCVWNQERDTARAVQTRRMVPRAVNMLR